MLIPMELAVSSTDNKAICSQDGDGIRCLFCWSVMSLINEFAGFLATDTG